MPNEIGNGVERESQRDGSFIVWRKTAKQGRGLVRSSGDCCILHTEAV